MRDKSRVWKVALLFLIVMTLMSYTASAGALENIADFFSNFKEDYGNLVINFILLGAVLFILQGFIPEKWVTKEQRPFVLIGLFVLTLFISIKFLKDQFIWGIISAEGGFLGAVLHLKVLVNFAVIIVLMILIKELILKGALKVKLEGKAMDTAVWILAIIIGIAVAVNPLKTGDPNNAWEYVIDGPGKYHYIWEKESIVPYRYYFLGDSNCFAFDGWGTKNNKTFSLKSEDGKLKKYKVTKDGTVKKKKSFIFDFLRPDEIEEDPDIKNQAKLAGTISESKGDLSTLSGQEQRDVTKLMGEVIKERKGGKYCYTHETIDRAIAGDKIEERYRAESDEIAGFGILMPPHLFIFITAWVLFGMLFKILKIGGAETGGNAITYTLAFIVAATIANAGIGHRMFMLIAEVIFTFVIYKQMTTENKFSWVNLLISLILVEFIAKTAFPNIGFGFFTSILFPTGVGIMYVGMWLASLVLLFFIIRWIAGLFSGGTSGTGGTP